MKKTCFWFHNWSDWEQLEPYKMYATDIRIKNAIPYLEYTIYTQKRYCEVCKKVEIESNRVNNY